MMKVTIIAISFLAFASTAFAGEIEGVITNYDPVTKMIVLENGDTFRLADGIELTDLKPGGKVIITYNDGTTDATSVAVVK